MENRVELKRLHAVICSIASDFDKFCNDNEITYYLMGGTALGAIRHGGFIPWDDDFDVFMDRKNYLKFLSAAEQFLDKETYYLQREDTPEWPLFFSKIRLNGTVYQELNDLNRDIHKGVYIDIMCLYGTYENKYLRYIQYFSGKVLSTIALSQRGYSTKSIAKKMALTSARIFNLRITKKALLWLVQHRDIQSTRYVGHFFGRAKFNSTTFERAYLSEPRYVKFEDLILPVPESVEEYLTKRFGKGFMEIPSQEVKDKYPSHLIELDLGRFK